VLNVGTAHRIVGGRHPIVEAGLWERGQMFVNNDCYVGGGVDEGSKRLWVITGYSDEQSVLMVVRIWVESQRS
jgi:DNA mismatch repair ATPase MutS